MIITGTSLFIFGLGYSALALAVRAMGEGFTVAGTSRNPATRDALSRAGICAYAFDSVPEEALSSASHILSSVPPSATSNVTIPVLQLYGGTLARLSAGRWLGYLSTTGVYGDHGGAWVDEDTPTQANTPRLAARVSAEGEWSGIGANIFRLAGIYGPARSALDEVRAGTARRIAKPGQVFSRIHVEDIAGALLASMRAPRRPGRIYNLADDLPAPQPEVVEYACNLLNAPLPPLVPFEKAELSPMAREFYSANRRVSNARLRGELGYALRYPTYREGLAQLLQS